MHRLDHRPSWLPQIPNGLAALSLSSLVAISACVRERTLRIVNDETGSTTSSNDMVSETGGSDGPSGTGMITDDSMFESASTSESFASTTESDSSGDDGMEPAEHVPYVLRASEEFNPNSCGLPDSLDSGVAQVGIGTNCPEGQVTWLYAGRFDELIGPEELPPEGANMDCQLTLAQTDYPTSGEGVFIEAYLADPGLSWEHFDSFEEIHAAIVDLDPVDGVSVSAESSENVTLSISSPETCRQLVVNALTGEGDVLILSPSPGLTGSHLFGSVSSGRAPMISAIGKF